MKAKNRLCLLVLFFTLLVPACEAEINGKEIYDVTPEEVYFNLCESRFMFISTFNSDIDDYVFVDAEITNRLAEWEYVEIWIGNWRAMAGFIAPHSERHFPVEIYEGEKISVDVYYNNEMCPQSGSTFKLER